MGCAWPWRYRALVADSGGQAVTDGCGVRERRESGLPFILECPEFLPSLCVYPRQKCRGHCRGPSPTTAEQLGEARPLAARSALLLRYRTFLLVRSCVNGPAC